MGEEGADLGGEYENLGFNFPEQLLWENLFVEKITIIFRCGQCIEVTLKCLVSCELGVGGKEKEEGVSTQQCEPTLTHYWSCQLASKQKPECLSLYVI